MHIVFFEFVTHFGGARRSTVEVVARLAGHTKVSVVDPYGCCEPFAEAVRAAGADYHVLCPQEARIVGGHKNVFHRMAKLAAALPDLLRIRHRAKKLLRTISPDALCCNNTKSMATVGSIRALRHVPLVGFMRGWYTPNMILPYAKYILARRCQALIAVSHATKAALMCAGIDPRKIVVIQNPVDIPDMAARAARPPDGPLPHSEKPIRILLPAGYMRTKGQHTAVRAVWHLVKAGYDPVLYLAGDVRFSDDESYVPRTRDLAETLGVADRVEWLGLRSDIPQLMKAATVVVLPTYTEGMPRAVLEAMALGRPVVATPVGGILDLILHGITGLNHDIEDDFGMAECIMRLADAPDQADAIGARGRELMQMNFRVEDHTQKLLELFQRLVADAGGEAARS